MSLVGGARACIGELVDCIGDEPRFIEAMSVVKSRWLPEDIDANGLSSDAGLTEDGGGAENKLRIWSFAGFFFGALVGRDTEGTGSLDAVSSQSRSKRPPPRPVFLVDADPDSDIAGLGVKAGAAPMFAVELLVSSFSKSIKDPVGAER